MCRSATLRTDGQPLPAATTVRHRSSKLVDTVAVAVAVADAAAEPDVPGVATLAAEPVAVGDPLGVELLAEPPASTGSLGVRPAAMPEAGAALDVAAGTPPYGSMAVRA